MYESTTNNSRLDKALLIWRAGQPFFVRKDFEQPASAEQVRKLREFSSDLSRALE